jgi:hypothetical protein
MLNPVYDLLPRMAWVVASDTCQRPSDFMLDAVSQTHCCPSPDYCCPNSLSSCAHPRALLYNATAAHGGTSVPRELVEDGWRRHYLTRTGVERLMRSQGLSVSAAATRISHSVCPASEWSDGSDGTPGCVLAMTNESVHYIGQAWRHAPTWTAPWPEDDDAVHMRSHSSARVGV